MSETQLDFAEDLGLPQGSVAVNRRVWFQDLNGNRAVQDAEDGKGWNTATKAVCGRIDNCFSTNDSVLKWAYKPAMGFIKKPIGLGPIPGMDDRIQNRDFSSEFSSHMEWKAKLEMVLDRIARPGLA